MNSWWLYLFTIFFHQLKMFQLQYVQSLTSVRYLFTFYNVYSFRRQQYSWYTSIYKNFLPIITTEFNTRMREETMYTSFDNVLENCEFMFTWDIITIQRVQLNSVNKPPHKSDFINCVYNFRLFTWVDTFLERNT